MSLSSQLSSSSSRQQPAVEVSPPDHGTEPLEDFSELPAGEGDALRGVLRREGWTTPTAIQAHAIPLLGKGYDVMASSQTGSGKSLMFCLPMVSGLIGDPPRNQQRRGGGNGAGSPSALVISPTRELASQTAEVLGTLCGPTALRVSSATGGHDSRRQRQQLPSADILVGTPGRILQFADERKLFLGDLRYLVIDEADRLLDLGFEQQMTRISKLLGRGGKAHQSVLCSATFPAGVQRMAADFLDPGYYFVSVGKVGSTESRIRQELEWVPSTDDRRKRECVVRQVEAFLDGARGRGTGQSSVLVFSNTKEGADALGRALSSRRGGGVRCGVIHGDKAQSERNRILQDFRAGKVQVLVATDVAARGLDVPSVGLVVQAEAPRSLDGYTHRVGRTGRAGASGQAVTLLDGRSMGIAGGLVDLLRDAGQGESIPPWLLGMSYTARARAMDEADLISAGSGDGAIGNSLLEVSTGEDSASSEINEKFTSQDFRRTAAAGSYGAGRDVAYRDFDDDAYRTDDDAVAASPESESSQAGDEGLGVELESGPPPSSPGAIAADSRTAEPSAASFTRPKPSAELSRAIKNIGDGTRNLDGGPSGATLRSLGSNQKLRFEYLGMFPFDEVAPLLTKAKTGRGDAGNDQGLPRVLMVAEKPSIAKAIADALSGRWDPRQRRGISRALPVYEFTTDAFAPVASEDGEPNRCVATVTSVIGHVFSLAFDAGGDQARSDPSDFFHLPVAKQEEGSSSKVRVVDHLRALAGRSDHLVLWLDCDPEGENIAHEVIAVVRKAIESNGKGGSTDDRIHRARFSAITPGALRDAFADLRKPDAALSRSVDARQELDLRVGVAFTRLLTWKTVGLARKRFDPATRVVSYGPCQTPALSFCVDRASQIEKFRPKDYSAVSVKISAPGGSNKNLPLTWSVPPGEAVEDTRKVAIRRKQHEASKSFIENATIERQSAKTIVDAASTPGTYAIATKIESTAETISAPVGLNTVALLEAGSKAMGMSPKQVMNVAEKLYSAGLISYPRTETTKYDPNGFDVRSALREHSRHELWGKSCSYLLRNKYSKSGRPPSRGRDVGDHPPITPLKAATRQEVGGGAAWRVYEFVTRNFLGSLHDELSFTRQVVSFEIEGGDADFFLENVSVNSMGFADCCRWVLNDIGASRSAEAQFKEGGKYRISSATMEKGKTRPPRFLQEHELILLMDENRIGTDASMAVHVNNIVERGYVQLCDEAGVPLRPPRPPRPGQKPPPRQIGRYMVPTSLGMGLLDLFDDLEDGGRGPSPAMVSKPAIRRRMEEEVKQIAMGELDKEECLDRNLRWFQNRHKELFDTLTRDRVMDFGAGLSQTRDTLKHWRKLDAFEAMTESNSGGNLRGSKKGSKGGGQQYGRRRRADGNTKGQGKRRNSKSKHSSSPAKSARGGRPGRTKVIS